MTPLIEEAAPNIKKFLGISTKTDPLIPQLEKFLIRCQNVYYNKGTELITDAEYDTLEDILKSVKPKSPALRTRAPVTKNTKTKVKLPYKMSSMDKIKPAAGNVQKWIDSHSGKNFVLSDKLDGSSIQINWEADGTLKVYTGGDGNIGGDISYLAPYLKLPKKKFKGIALRGEAIVSRGAFKKYKDVFKNPRAMANGLVNRETIKDHVQDLEVVFYTVLHPTMTVSAGFKWLKANGFNTAPFKVVSSITEAQLSKILTQRKAKSKYDLDGIIISQDVRQVPTLENPTYAVAFKETQGSDIVQTTVLGVEWNISPHGYLFPTVLVKPVELFGTTVRRASGKTANSIEKLKIGKGAVVSITKGGEVIPDILDVIKPALKGDMPSEKEFGAYHWDKNHTHLVLDEIHTNETVVTKRIVRFFAAMKIDALKGSTVQKLVDAGYDSILKIVRLTPQQIGEAIGSQKNAATIYKSMVERFGEADLAQFMDASGAFSRGFGSRRVEMIQKVYPDILELEKVPAKQLYTKLSAVTGIGPEMAKLFVEGLPTFIKWMSKFPKKLLAFKEKEVVKQVGKIMKGHRVVFTGVRDDELEQWIVSQGGEIVNSGKKATICIVKDIDTTSTKAKEARSVGAKIMAINGFNGKYRRDR